MKLLTFGQALEELRNGHRVRRTSWFSGTFIQLIQGDGPRGVFIGTKDGREWCVESDQLLAADWVKLSEEGAS